MKPIKTAYILTPIEFGGAVKVSCTFLERVDRSKFRIHPIILIRPWEQETLFEGELKKHGYPYTRIPVAVKPREKGRDWFRVVRCYGMIHSCLRKGSFDLVHTHGYFADLTGIPASKMLGIPVLSTCHGFIGNDRNLKLYNWLDFRVLRFADRIIAVSDGIRNQLAATGIDGNRIGIIQNAVRADRDPASFEKNRSLKRTVLGISEGVPAIGYIGRLSEEKGIAVLIDACARLRARNIPLKLVIIGEGPQRRELESAASNAGLDGSVAFAGFQRDIEQWLPSLDVFVLPSFTEGTPMALLEAMACGIPVVASAVGGIPQVVRSGENGILTPPGSPEEIMKALVSISGDRAFRKRLSEAAKKTIQTRYSASGWIRKIEAEYEETAGTGHA